MIDETATPNEPLGNPGNGGPAHRVPAEEVSAERVGAGSPTGHGTGDYAAPNQAPMGVPTADESVSGSPVVAEPVAAEPAVRTVYVEAPVPPRMRGNRGFGVVAAVLATIAFSLVYALVVLVVMPVFAPAQSAGFDFMRFVNDSAFLVPIAVFFVAFVLLVLLANRANWWAYIIGSLIVGVVVYVATVAIVLLLNNAVSMTPNEAARQLQILAGKPWLIIAGIVAREMAIWFGAVVAARGRRLRVRNAEAREEFERESARKRAQFERPTVETSA